MHLSGRPEHRWAVSHRQTDHRFRSWLLQAFRQRVVRPFLRPPVLRPQAFHHRAGRQTDHRFRSRLLQAFHHRVVRPFLRPLVHLRAVHQTGLRFRLQVLLVCQVADPPIPRQIHSYRPAAWWQGLACPPLPGSQRAAVVATRLALRWSVRRIAVWKPRDRS